MDPSSLFTPVHDPLSKDSSNSFPLDGVDLADVTDEKIVSIAKECPVIYSLWSTRIVRLSADLVLKFGDAIQPQEIEAMKCVLSRTNVRTPKLHRYFFTAPQNPSFDQCGYMIMDYVDGDTLFDVWESISHEKRTCIIEQIAEMVAQIQAITFDQPGPLGGGRSRGFWFSDYGAGPFENKDHFNTWLTGKLEFSKRVGQARQDLPPFNYSSFVLVHQDMHPSNIILDSSNKPWIIDWGCAGAYPAIFEAATMCASSRFPEFDALLLPRVYNDTTEREHLMGAAWSAHIGGSQ